MSPLTIYIDDGSISASAHNRTSTTNMVELAFLEAHAWLTTRGMKLDQNKSELIHFTRSTRGRHSGPGPSATIPSSNPTTPRTILPTKTICYLGVWLDSQLNFSEHIRRMTSKAIGAAHALRLLGNSIQGIHQMHARQLYYSAILLVATYGLHIFWKSKNGNVLSSLVKMQNRCLRMITGAFRTTNINAMEIEASIPPLDIWLNYKLKMEALCMSRLADNHPVTCRVYPDQRENPIPQTLPPLPPFKPSKRYRMNPRLKFNTCITHISKHILDGTERISLNAEPPQRISELEIPDRVKIFTPPTTPGVSVKEQWRDDHINFVTELEDNDDFLFVYSDGSLMEQGGRRRTGYGLVGYNKGEIVFERSGA